MALNLTVIQGNFVETPELKITPNNTYTTSFRFAWNEVRSDGKSRALFINCVAWKEKADFIVKHFTKGQGAIVSGRLIQNDYTDKDGNKRSYINLEITDIQFCGKKEETSQSSYIPLTNTYTAQKSEYVPLINDDDLPF